jgi:hypothetical protein
MSRLPNWREALRDYLAAHARTVIRPGQHDCITWSNGARAAMTGVDVMAGHRGSYSTVEEGLQLCLQHGFDSHIAFVTHGLTEIPVAYAQVGDLVEMAGEDGLAAMGIVGGAQVHVLHLRGAGIAPLTDARRAWRV